jgi:hypothetical protein
LLSKNLKGNCPSLRRTYIKANLSFEKVYIKKLGKAKMAKATDKIFKTMPNSVV